MNSQRNLITYKKIHNRLGLSKTITSTTQPRNCDPVETFSKKAAVIVKFYVRESEDRYINDINDAANQTLTQVKENTLKLNETGGYKYKVAVEGEYNKGDIYIP